MRIHRQVTAWLWQFVWFRVAIVPMVQVLPDGGISRLLASETPLLIALREFGAVSGDPAVAMEASRLTRQFESQR